MMKPFVLLTCALALGQTSAERAEWQLAPQLTSGLELVYRGTYIEESLIPNVQYQRQYRLETNLLILEANSKDAHLVVMTALRLYDPRQPRGDEPGSVRLGQARVDSQGRIRTLQHQPLEVSLAGPPTLECGCFVPAPLVRLRPSAGWDVAEEGRPVQHWQVIGIEAMGGISCVKVTCVQQSDDWLQTRADHTAWRRRDTLWIGPQLNVAQKVERIIEQRAPARDLPTHRTVVRYELDSHMKFPGKFFVDRRHDALKACKYQEDAQAVLRQPQLYQTQIDALLQRLMYHLDHQEKTPYRQAVLHLKRTLESAKKGEAPVPHAIEEPILPAIQTLTIGQQAPDFSASSFTEKAPVRLQTLRGTPILVAYYNPATPLGEQVLRYLKRLSEERRGQIAILAMAVTLDEELVRKQHAQMKLTFPIVDGNAMRLTFGAATTPRFVLIDGAGTVRLTQTGWGIPTPIEIEMALSRCGKK